MMYNFLHGALMVLGFFISETSLIGTYLDENDKIVMPHKKYWILGMMMLLASGIIKHFLC